MKERGEVEASEQPLRGSLKFLENKSTQGNLPIEDIFYIAWIYGILGEKERCLDWLERGENEGYMDYRLIEVNPMFDSVREEERYREMIWRMKEKIEKLKTEVWLAEGK